MSSKIKGLETIIGTEVYMDTNDDYISGRTMEKPSTSPTERNPNRIVVRIKWADKSESIENLDNLY